MTVNLSNLQPQMKSKHRKKRVGRGNASGHGTYSGRGQKGQRSRSGGKKGLKIKGLRRSIRNFPKLSGFKSYFSKAQVVSLEKIQEKFKDNKVVKLADLVKSGLVKDSHQRVKILCKWPVNKKLAPLKKSAKSEIAEKRHLASLTIEAHAFSKKAKEIIEKTGGRAVIKN